MEPSTCLHGVAGRTCRTCYQRHQSNSQTRNTTSRHTFGVPNHEATLFPRNDGAVPQPSLRNQALFISPGSQLTSGSHPPPTKNSDPNSHSHRQSNLSTRISSSANYQTSQAAPRTSTAKQSYQMNRFLTEVLDYKRLLVGDEDLTEGERGKKHRQALRRKVRILEGRAEGF